MANFLRIIDFDSELLSQLSSQSIFKLFPSFHFSSRKFPFQRECGIATPLAHEHAVISADQSRNNFCALSASAFHRWNNRSFSIIDKKALPFIQKN